MILNEITPRRVRFVIFVFARKLFPCVRHRALELYPTFIVPDGLVIPGSAVRVFRLIHHFEIGGSDHARIALRVDRFQLYTVRPRGEPIKR